MQVNAKKLQQALDLLKYNVKEVSATYHNLLREKVRLNASCKLLQYQIEDMTSTFNCINTCNSTTTISSKSSSTFKSTTLHGSATPIVSSAATNPSTVSFQSTTSQESSSATIPLETETTTIEQHTLSTSLSTDSSLKTTTTNNISLCPKPCVNGECKPNGTAYSCFCYPGFGGGSCTDSKYIKLY